MQSIIQAIPAPSSGGEPWGRSFRLYGIMIAIGVIAGLEVARRRWQKRGGDPEDMATVALVAVPAGLIGARLYHVITDNQLYRDHWLDNPFDLDQSSPLAVWKGGLGIPGGLALAFLAGLWIFRRKGMRVGPAMDAAAPAVPLAQAIGRLGNYFNQELFGGPTDLPWAVRIDPEFRPPEFYDQPTFHPTFLYEGLWNLGLMAVLLWVDSRWRLRPGRLAVLYVGGYATGRLWVEAMRSDKANIVLGLRVNIWTSLIAMAVVAVVFAVFGLRVRPGDDESPYVDGHRFDPEVGIVPGPGAQGEAGSDADADAGAEAEVAGESAPGEPEAVALDEDTAASGSEPEAEPVADAEAEPDGSPEAAVEPDPDPGDDDQRGTLGDEVKSDADP
jgi:prolipoprotein diacylglyceryl transferase